MHHRYQTETGYTYIVVTGQPTDMVLLGEGHNSGAALDNLSETHFQSAGAEPCADIIRAAVDVTTEEIDAWYVDSEWESSAIEAWRD